MAPIGLPGLRKVIFKRLKSVNSWCSRKSARCDGLRIVSQWAAKRNQRKWDLVNLRLARLVLVMSIEWLAWAQAPAVNSISGVVQDSSAAGIPGASITLTKAGEAGQRVAAADSTGAFRLDELTAGNYEIEVRKEGFKPSITRVRIGARPPAPLTVVLSVAELRQGVTVSDQISQVSAETSENLNAVAVDQQAIQNLPVFDQDFVGTMSRFLDAGATGTNGVTIIVDGLEATRVPVSASAVQEVKINNDAYSAEYSRPGRGRIEIITKPGSQEYHGTVNVLFRDYLLNARDPFAVTRPQEQRRIFEGSLSGPFGHSRSTSFLITATRQEQDLETVVFALGPSGPIQENVPTPQRNTEFSGTLNHAIGQSHIISFRGTSTYRTIHNQGVGGYVRPEAGADFGDREDLFFFNHRGLITPKLLTQFRMLYSEDSTRPPRV